MHADIPYDDGVLVITRTETPTGLALSGEIDESTYPVLVRTLKQMAGQDQTLHLDLAGLQYCDVAGLRAIVGLAPANGGRPVRHLVLHDVPAHLRTALRVLGWDALPGLTITEGKEAS